MHRVGKKRLVILARLLVVLWNVIIWCFSQNKMACFLCNCSVSATQHRRLHADSIKHVLAILMDQCSDSQLLVTIFNRHLNAFICRPCVRCIESFQKLLKVLHQKKSIITTLHIMVHLRNTLANLLQFKTIQKGLDMTCLLWIWYIKSALQEFLRL